MMEKGGNGRLALPRLFVSAAHKSSGKTTFTIGLCAALAARGLKVQPFKKGPDYIDPLWHSAAAGRVCRNLDFHNMPPAEIGDLFARLGKDADIAVIEGNKGLFDGVDLEGSNSSATLAHWLDAPVMLVIDTAGMTRGLAPLLLGYQAFDPNLRIAGVILNKVGGPRHEKKLREVVAHYTDIPVLGALPRLKQLEIVERHLGLIPSNEEAEAEATIAAIRHAVESHVDIDAVLHAARQAAPLEISEPKAVPACAASPLRIAIARDAAFGFYYPDDIEAMEQAGAELITLDTLRDPTLPPDLDGLFIGGGFPETQAQALEANSSLRHGIRNAIEGGLPTYAECGGLMYLTGSVSWQGERREMVGALPAQALMHDRPQGRGYVRLRETDDFPWPVLAKGPGIIAAHEFHYSALTDIQGPARFAYEVVRGSGIDGRHDGWIYRNTLANYAHMRSVGPAPWAPRFVAFARSIKSAGDHRQPGKIGAGQVLVS